MDEIVTGACPVTCSGGGERVYELVAGDWVARWSPGLPEEVAVTWARFPRGVVGVLDVDARLDVSTLDADCDRAVAVRVVSRLLAALPNGALAGALRCYWAEVCAWAEGQAWDGRPGGGVDWAGTLRAHRLLLAAADLADPALRRRAFALVHGGFAGDGADLVAVAVALG